MKQTTIALAVLTMSLTAFAGKMERDLVTKEVAPAIAETEAKFQSQCGCPVKITLDQGTLKSMDELRSVKHMAKNFTEGIDKYCTDAPSKKAVCQLRTLTFTKGVAGFTFKAGAGVAMTDGQTSTLWEQVTRVLDK